MVDYEKSTGLSVKWPEQATPQGSTRDASHITVDFSVAFIGHPHF